MPVDSNARRVMSWFQGGTTLVVSIKVLGCVDHLQTRTQTCVVLPLLAVLDAIHHARIIQRPPPLTCTYALKGRISAATTAIILQTLRTAHAEQKHCITVVHWVWSCQTRQSASRHAEHGNAIPALALCRYTRVVVWKSVPLSERGNRQA